MSQTILETIKLMMGLEDNEKDSILMGVIDIQTKALLIKINEFTVPQELEFIVVETAIIRFSRIGSEGLLSENVDVISQTFVEDIFEQYNSIIALYKSSKSTFKPSVLRMV